MLFWKTALSGLSAEGDKENTRIDWHLHWAGAKSHLLIHGQSKSDQSLAAHTWASFILGGHKLDLDPKQKKEENICLFLTKKSSTVLACNLFVYLHI